MQLAYFSYFHSIMSYGILLWGSAADINTIFVLQKRAIHAIYNLGMYVQLGGVCGMSFLVRCFRDDTTCAGNAPLITLAGGGDHLTPGDPYARLSYFSIKKQKKFQPKAI
ncbi:unnamed protein product [Leptidea sinapis]|uniref:Uncharacterized protein n=1 Tax=Leptidea sinapis TaxID=189913 RepID=A0A5E4QCH0_9NEOP|nr:unnamed protein product [Leptidea sinapis]